ncbi:MAG: hypothetical protein AAF490_12050 [Chloroflexota bacterium]
MKNTVEQIVKQLATELGDQLEAAFLYGSLAQGFYQEGESDINLFLVISDDSDMHQLRQQFEPIWEQHQDKLKRGPCFAHKHAFERHLQLNTLLAHHVVREGEKLYGSKPILENKIGSIKAAEAYAHLAYEAMVASQALMPTTLDEDTAVVVQRKLHSFVRRIQRGPISKDETNAQLFARIQNYLVPIISKLPEVKAFDETLLPSQTSPILPGLAAIYEETGKLVLAFSQLTPHQLLRTDWKMVTEQVPDSALGVEITGAAQLFLIASYEHPLHMRFRKYEHSWGPDFVSELDPPISQIMRQAARLPSQILVDTMPDAFLTHKEEDYPKLVHDFQNKLLNIQLEHELMVRFGLCERFTPPAPLPGRDEDARVRIDAIFKNLEWWTDFYASQISNTPE